MIMSIFPTNHAHMEHSRVTHSTSMGEDMIHQYVSLCWKHSNYFIFFLPARLRVTWRGPRDECVLLCQLLHPLLWIQDDLVNVLEWGWWYYITVVTRSQWSAIHLIRYPNWHWGGHEGGHGGGGYGGVPAHGWGNRGGHGGRHGGGPLNHWGGVVRPVGHKILVTAQSPFQFGFNWNLALGLSIHNLVVSVIYPRCPVSWSQG